MKKISLVCFLLLSCFCSFSGEINWNANDDSSCPSNYPDAILGHTINSRDNGDPVESLHITVYFSSISDGRNYKTSYVVKTHDRFQLTDSWSGPSSIIYIENFTWPDGFIPIISPTTDTDGDGVPDGDGDCTCGDCGGDCDSGGDW